MLPGRSLPVFPELMSVPILNGSVFNALIYMITSDEHSGESIETLATER